MAAESLQLEVVTLEREVIRDAASEVQLPGAAGFLGVLPGHTPLLTEVGTGVLSYHKGGQIFYSAVSGGIAEVLGDRVTVIADSAERAEEIDVERAQKALATAQEKYAAGASDPATDWDAAQRAVARARTRLEAAQHAGARAHAA
jgi:F-type H+-transporting ATPase subunit epsilon